MAVIVNKKQQSLYMKIRLVRLAARRWNTSIAEAANIFWKQGVFAYIESNFELFHIQGDDAVLDDILLFLGAEKC